MLQHIQIDPPQTLFVNVIFKTKPCITKETCTAYKTCTECNPCIEARISEFANELYSSSGVFVPMDSFGSRAERNGVLFLLSFGKESNGCIQFRFLVQYREHEIYYLGQSSLNMVKFYLNALFRCLDTSSFLEIGCGEENACKWIEKHKNICSRISVKSIFFQERIGGPEVSIVIPPSTSFSEKRDIQAGKRQRIHTDEKVVY
jgi:hypothetical protein